MARSSAGAMQTTIDQGAADTTTAANVGERTQSSDATLAISLGSGLIDDSGTIMNTSGLGAILINRGAAISNLSGGSVVGRIDIRATDTASSSLRNAGSLSGNPIINFIGGGAGTDDDRAIDASFALAPGITPFTALADHRDRDSAFLGASVNAFFKRNLSAFLSYDADLGRQGSRVDAGRYGLAFKF